MKRHYLLSFLGTVVAIALTLAPATRGEDAPPPAPAVVTADQPAAPAAVEPAKPETPPLAPLVPETPAAPSAATVPPVPAPQLDEPSKEPEAAEPPAPDLRRLDSGVEQTVKETAPKHAHVHHASTGSGNERVSFTQNAVVGKDEKVETAVSILGSTTVEGEVTDSAVSILGSTTVNGSVGGEAVAILGSVYVNGPVGGEVVAVGGNVELGPKAVVQGEVVAAGGSVHRDPDAVVHGGVQQITIAQHFPSFDWLHAWMQSALFKGRLLSFASGTGWAWMVAAAFLGCYLLLALIFPRGIEKCAETLEQQPGFTLLAALLAMLAMPLVFLLLAITGVGVLVIPFLGLALFAGKLFGRAAMLAWLGRRFTGLLGAGLLSQAVVAVLIGGLLVMGLYLVPIVAFIVSMLIGVLGLGMVIYTLILSMRRNGAKRAPAVVVASVMAPSAAGMGETPAGMATPPVVPAMPAPPIVSAATLPRAGFWVRTGAVMVDLILCCLVVKLVPWGHFSVGLCLLLLAAYGAALWKLRGTTVGGSIFHLKVVRLDGRPLDWTTTIVRALSCFLSLAVVGLGFLWVAFDDEKQSWHDKIAGTVVVKMPKSVSLI
ncbi:MAG: RDD family protein [Opitutaceae bacterium]|nr:RDD family protein [Opitutaceae bacterium]